MPTSAATLHIGEVADRVGLSLRTVHYYEEQGLFEPAGRTDGGFRLYTEEQVDRLLFIKQMKPLGFSVEEMGELLGARDDLCHSHVKRRKAAEDQLAVFARDAAERCEKLREQLASAEEFARQLARHAPSDATETGN